MGGGGSYGGKGLARYRESVPVTAVGPILDVKRSAFLIAADDGHRYWCKTDDEAMPRVGITEQIVGRLGASLGVAVCDVEIVSVAHLVGPGFAITQSDGTLSYRTISSKWVHGSRDIGPCAEIFTLGPPEFGDNAVRHAGFFALHDWLVGADAQWLLDEIGRTWSHDHGGFFGVHRWTKEILDVELSTVYTPALAQDPLGVDVAEIDRLATRLEAVQPSDLQYQLADLVDYFAVASEEVQHVGHLLAARAPGAAQRLRALPV